MKVRETKHTTYICDYCRNQYYSEEKALKCESSHTLVSVGDVIEYGVSFTAWDWGHPYNSVEMYRGTIIDEGVKDGYPRFLVEQHDGTREWIDKWRYYRKEW